MRDRPLKWFLAVLLILGLIGASFSQHSLNLDRERMGLTRSAPLDNAPPVLAFTTVALGGFRGLIANALWIRMDELQQEGKYFEMVQLALAPTIPHQCSDAFLISCRDLAKEYDVGLHTHVAESKLQVIAGYQRYGTSLAAHMDELGAGVRPLHRRARRVARRRRHETAGRPRRIGGAQSRIQHAARQRPCRRARHAHAKDQRRDRHRRCKLLGQPERL